MAQAKDDQISRIDSPARNAPDRTMQEAAGEAARAGRNLADGAAKTGEEAARANADALRTTVENAGGTMRAGWKTAESTLHGYAETMSRAFGVGDQRVSQLAQQSAQNMRIVSEATAALARGAQDVSREWLIAVQDRAGANAEALGRLAACRSAPELIALHSDLWRESLQRSVKTGQAIAHASLRAVDDASRAIESAPAQAA